MCCPIDCAIDPDCEDIGTNWPVLTMTIASPDCALLDGCSTTMSNMGGATVWNQDSSDCFGGLTLFLDVDNCWRLTGAASDCIEFNDVRAIEVTCPGEEGVPYFHFRVFASGGEFGCPLCAGAQVDIYITA